MKRIIVIGLISGISMILFQTINLFVQYQYLKTEYYVGLVAISFGLTGYLFKKGSQATAPLNPPDLLSNREMQVLHLILQGKSNKEIAAEQFIEISTVKTHINNMYAKLGVTSRKEVRQKFGSTLFPPLFF